MKKSKLHVKNTFRSSSPASKNWNISENSEAQLAKRHVLEIIMKLLSVFKWFIDIEKNINIAIKSYNKFTVFQNLT